MYKNMSYLPTNTTGLFIDNIDDNAITGFESYVNSVKNKDDIKIVTHNGTFHADDVMAVAIITLILQNENNKKILIRTREKDIIEGGTFCLDVGGQFDPKRGRIDHHQRGGAGPMWVNEESEDSFHTAACGLTWFLGGRMAIRETLNAALLLDNDNNNKAIDDNHIDRIWPKLLPIFCAIDSTDVGYNQFKYIGATLSSFISSFNVGDVYAECESQHASFEKMVEIMSDFIAQNILRVFQSILFEDTCEAAYKNTDSNIMILPVGGNWKDWVLSNWERTKHIELVVFPSGDDWRVQTMPDDKNNLMSMRHPAPESLRGLRDSNLYEHLKSVGCDIPTVEFVHPGGFIGGAKDMDDAISLAKYWLAN